MGFNCGIVGLPNVGKSTLFNALTSTAAAEAANYPFCTIEPNTGRVSVPDTRLENIAAFIEVRINSSISLFVGHISFKKIFFPSLLLPKGSLYKSKFIDPAKAYATTKGGEAR